MASEDPASSKVALPQSCWNSSIRQALAPMVSYHFALAASPPKSIR